MYMASLNVLFPPLCMSSYLDFILFTYSFLFDTFTFFIFPAVFLFDVLFFISIDSISWLSTIAIVTTDGVYAVGAGYQSGDKQLTGGEGQVIRGGPSVRGM